MEFTKHSIRRAKERLKRKNSSQDKAVDRMKNKMKEIIMSSTVGDTEYMYTYPNLKGYSLCYVVKNDTIITVYSLKLNERLKKNRGKI